MSILELLSFLAEKYKFIKNSTNVNLKEVFYCIQRSYIRGSVPQGMRVCSQEVIMHSF